MHICQKTSQQNMHTHTYCIHKQYCTCTAHVKYFQERESVCVCVCVRERERGILHMVSGQMVAKCYHIHVHLCIPQAEI